MDDTATGEEEERGGGGSLVLRGVGGG